MKKKIVFIVNPISGVFKKDNIVGQIENNIDHSKFDFSIKYTKEPGHATEICRDHVAQGTEFIIAVGGDGSVNEIAKGLVGSKSTLGIIPAGSGNGLAHHLKIPVNYRKAIDVINRGKIIKIDTGSINDILFVSIAGIGFDGFVASRFAKSERRGFLTYLRIVTEEYPDYKPKRYTIRVNNQIIKTRALFLTFANSDQFGYNTTIAPSARIDDGLLEVIIMKKPPIIEIPLLASLLYWRKIDKSKFIEILRAPELFVETKKKRWVNIDGEPMKLGKKLHVKIHPQSLNIIVPNSSGMLSRVF
ncbi:MAG: diacylglycerol kinase family lipid kinase [Bacteroidales bacterium]|nr:diacylglycerol kinase family lipid kinase [Bacteroidales bacterium]